MDAILFPFMMSWAYTSRISIKALSSSLKSCTGLESSRTLLRIWFAYCLGEDSRPAQIQIPSQAHPIRPRTKEFEVFVGSTESAVGMLILFKFGNDKLQRDALMRLRSRNIGHRIVRNQGDPLLGTTVQGMLDTA